MGLSDSRSSCLRRCIRQQTPDTAEPLSRTGSSALLGASLLQGHDDGQALIEMSLCLPVLLLIVFGIFTFGIAFSNYLVLDDATNTGARQLAISRGQSTDPCSTASTAVIAATPTLARANLAFSYTFNGIAASGTTCPSAANNLVQGSTARITVTYPCTLASFRWSFAAGSCTLTASTAELIQ